MSNLTWPTILTTSLGLYSTMTNFLKTSLGWLEQMASPPSTHLLRTTLRLFFLVFSLPRGRNRRKSYASIASDPTYVRVGAGGRAGWVLPWFPSLLMRGRGRGRGAGDNPDTWQITYTSYAQCPRKSATKSNPNLRQIVSSSLDNPSFPLLGSPFPCLTCLI